MKKILFTITILLMFVLSACGSSTSETSITITDTVSVLEVGDTHSLMYTTSNPNGHYIKHVTSDRDVLIITDEGIIHATGDGTATITVIVGDVSDTITLTVLTPLSAEALAVFAAIDAFTDPVLYADYLSAQALYDALDAAEQPRISNRGALDTALNYFNDALAVETLVAAITTPLDRTQVEAARAAYDALDANQQSLVTSYNLLTSAETDFAASDAVITLLLGLVEPYTEDNVQAARTAYDALTVGQQALVTDISNLTAGEAYLQEAYDVDDLINAFSSPLDRDEITAARTAYDALDTYQQSLVSSSAFNSLTQAEADVVAADAVVTEIAALTTPYDQAAVSTARTSYDALTASQQGLVSNYQTLLDAEASFITLNYPFYALQAFFSLQTDTKIDTFDFDNDNDLDFVFAASGAIQVYENNGDGTYSRIFAISSPFQNSIHLGDVDNDGYDDIVVGVYSSHTSVTANVYVLMNTSGTGFSVKNIEKIANAFVYDVTSGDYNGDGLTDIAAAVNMSPQTLYYYLNDGNGNYVSHQYTGTGSNFTVLVSTDLDGDGDDEIIHNSGQAYVIQDYDTTLNDFDYVTFTSYSFITHYAELFDYNGDGTMDFVMQNFVSGALAVAIIDPDTLTFTFETIGTMSSPYSKNFDFGDINKDGFIDFVVASETDGTLQFFMNKGDNTFILVTVETQETTSYSPQLVDINGDGFLDVLVIQNSDTNTYVNSYIYQLSDDELAAQAVIAEIDAAISPIDRTAVAAARVSYDALTAAQQRFVTNYDALLSAEADIDAAQAVIDLIDAFSDPVLESEVTAARTAYDALTAEQQALVTNYALLQAQLPIYQVDLIHTGTSYARYVDAGDFTGDGTMDTVFVTYMGTLKTYIVFGDETPPGGNEVFALTSTGSLASGIKVADFNGDSHLDILVAYSASNYLNLYLGNGDGTFTETQVSGITSVYYLEIADVDVDGDMDFIVSRRAAGVDLLVAYLNDGSGQFTALNIVENIGGSYKVIPTDIDGDNDIDFVLTTYYAPYNIYIIVNDNGTYNSQLIFVGPDQYSSIDVIDYDGDNDLDIVIGTFNHEFYIITLDPSVSPIGFSRSPVYTVDVNVTKLIDFAMIDYDKDGDLDIIATSLDTGAYIYINEGTYVFTSDWFMQAPSGYDVVLKDMDGDGDSDILFTLSQSSTDASVYLVTLLR